MSEGCFITLEGPEGAGKSTQAEMLLELFRKAGREVLRTREPGGVKLSEKIRELVLDIKNENMCPEAELFLYAAARAQHTGEAILPALKSGKSVICERYTHASIAYQGYGRGLGAGKVKKINEISSMGLNPDITFVLDIEAARGLARIKGSERCLDRLESEDIDFHRKVRKGYLDMARSDKDVIIINAQMPLEKVHGSIAGELKKREMI